MEDKKRKIILQDNCRLEVAVEKLDENPLGIIVFVNSANILKGILTDGDIRRLLLKRTKLNILVSEVMNKIPKYITVGYSRTEALRIFSEQIQIIPVVDFEKKVVDILFYNEYFDSYKSNKSLITVRAKAPLRVSFAGGGTDTNSFIDNCGGVVISATINKYCFGSLTKRDDNRIKITSKDYNTEIVIPNINKIKYNGELDLIKSVIKIMKPNFGFDLFLETKVTPGTGLGGSSTVASVVAGLLNFFRENKFDDYEIADIIYQAERIELAIEGGWQDQYAAVFGGFNYIEFRKNDVIVHPLRIMSNVLDELEMSLVLCFTGETRNSGEISARQKIAYKNRDKKIVSALNNTKEFAINMKNVLLKGDLLKFGELLHEAWVEKKKFDKNITNGNIEKLYSAGRNAGAIGGKVLGAGGGGYILFFCSPLKRNYIQNSLINAGAEILDFNFDFKGLHIWSI